MLLCASSYLLVCLKVLHMLLLLALLLRLLYAVMLLQHLLSHSLTTSQVFTNISQCLQGGDALPLLPVSIWRLAPVTHTSTQRRSATKACYPHHGHLL